MEKRCIILLLCLVCISIVGCGGADNGAPSQGNAWDDITINGVTYEQAIAEGWGEEWMSLAEAQGTEGTSNIQSYDNVISLDEYKITILPSESPKRIQRRSDDYSIKSVAEIMSDLYYDYGDLSDYGIIWETAESKNARVDNYDNSKLIDPYKLTSVEMLEEPISYVEEYTDGGFTVTDTYLVRVKAESEYGTYSGICRLTFRGTETRPYSLISMDGGRYHDQSAEDAFEIKKMPPNAFAKEYFESYTESNYPGAVLLDAEIELIHEGVYPVCLAHATCNYYSEDGDTEIINRTDACVFYNGQWVIRNEDYAPMGWNSFREYFDGELQEKLYADSGYTGYEERTIQLSLINTIYYDIDYMNTCYIRFPDLEANHVDRAYSIPGDQIAIVLTNAYSIDGKQFYDRWMYYSNATDVTYKMKFCYGFVCEIQQAEGGEFSLKPEVESTILAESTGPISNSDALDYIKKIRDDTQMPVIFDADEFLHTIYGDKFYIGEKVEDSGMTWVAFGAK